MLQPSEDVQRKGYSLGCCEWVSTQYGTSQ